MAGRCQCQYQHAAVDGGPVLWLLYDPACKLRTTVLTTQYWLLLAFDENREVPMNIV